MQADYFSQCAREYARFRPAYPDALFRWLAGVVPGHTLVWDCATGNGQAAVGLAEWFERVIATDASEDQIAQARPHPRVEYRAAPAERSGLDPGSADLVTVAQALHWLPIEAFYHEVRRVLRPGGVLAVWGYGNPMLQDARLHRIVDAFNNGTLTAYWPPGRAHLVAGYRDLPFPFDEIVPPTLTLDREMTLPELAGYLRTWSGTQRYIQVHGADPVADVEDALRAAWGDPERARVVRWPLPLRVGVPDPEGRGTNNEAL
jgi:SAM-dependent methyltransferase